MTAVIACKTAIVADRLVQWGYLRGGATKIWARDEWAFGVAGDTSVGAALHDYIMSADYTADVDTVGTIRAVGAKFAGLVSSDVPTSAIAVHPQHGVFRTGPKGFVSAPDVFAIGMDSDVMAAWHALRMCGRPDFDVATLSDAVLAVHRAAPGVVGPEVDALEWQEFMWFPVNSTDGRCVTAEVLT